jgi:hypothetical protein
MSAAVCVAVVQTNVLVMLCCDDCFTEDASVCVLYQQFAIQSLECVHVFLFSCYRAVTVHPCQSNKTTQPAA